MRNVLVFGASNSKHSINQKFAVHTANQLKGVHLNIVDLNDFEMPLYGIDKENDNGIPDLAYQFKEHISDAHGIIISFAEHNGVYSVAFKNIYDWVSRIKGDVWQNKPMLLLATSPGGRGAKGVLGIATNAYARKNTSGISSFSLPSFNDNFSEELGVTDESLKRDLETKIENFRSSLFLFKD